MFGLKDFFLRLAALFRGGRIDREIEEELRFHLDMRMQENLEAGMSPEEARRDALRRFGNVTLIRERGYDIRGGGMIEILLQDLRYGARMLLKNPGFTAVAMVSLALGIGACTAIFSIVDAVLLRPLPYPEPERVLEVREVSAQGRRMRFTEPNFKDLRERNGSLEAIAQYSSWPATVIGGGRPVRAQVARVSGDFFRALGVGLAAGRAFLPEESAPGGRAAAIVSYGFWQRLLGGGDFVGRTLKIDDETYEVIGVMPPGITFPRDAEVWLPRELLPPQTSRTAHNWNVIARRRPDVAFEAAQADVSAIGRQIKAEFGKDVDAVDFALIPMQEYLVGHVRQGLMIVLAAVGVLLLIACANVANLLLAQVAARRKEFAVRAALGASRLRLARQFVSENVLLALGGGALGALLSVWGVGLLLRLNERALPRAGEIDVDARALTLALGLSLLVAVVLGLVPALRLSTSDLQRDLKEAGRGNAENAGAKRLRGLLVVAQFALTLVLLVGAGLLARSFLRLLAVDPGFRVENTVVMDLSLPWADDPQGGRRLRQAFSQLREGRGQVEEVTVGADRQRRLAVMMRQLYDRLQQLPGVTAVGGVSGLPMSDGGGNGTFWIENSLAQTGYAEYRQASAGYFAAMGIPLLRGRLFEPTDTTDTQHVAVISQALARAAWPDEDPIGKRIQFGNMDGDTHMLQIVGIVGDVRDRGLDTNVAQTVYASSMQRPQRPDLSVVARGQADPATLMPAMRRAVEELNAELPVNFRTVAQVYASSLDNRRFSLVIFAVFAAVALLLAAIGIYGVMSYSVNQRTQEIGIRMALGAERRDVLRLVVGQGLRLALVGVALGFGAAFALTRLMASLLYGVGATDPATFAVTSLALVGVALLACYLPARRATRVDPLTALRYE